MAKLKLNYKENSMSYIVPVSYGSNIEDTLNEWIRFSSYLKPKELAFFKEVSKKQINQLTPNEIKKYNKIQNQKKLSKLFIKYKNQTCNQEEYDQVSKFMENSLESFMEKRLTKGEIKKSYTILSEFKKLSIETLNEYIDEQMRKYKELSLFEAYILYKVKIIRYNKVNNETNDKIFNDKMEKGNNLRKKLIKDYGL